MDDKLMSSDPVTDDKLTSQSAVSFSDPTKTLHNKTLDVTLMNKGLGQGVVKCAVFRMTLSKGGSGS